MGGRFGSSLWRGSHPEQLPDKLSRWDDYPHFREALEEYGTPRENVVVRWERFDDFLKGFDDDEVESGSLEHVEKVASWIQEGVDVPPLVRWRGDVFDGRHRAHAARGLGIRLAPVIDLEYVDG